jgi:hypothetical protein
LEARSLGSVVHLEATVMSRRHLFAALLLGAMATSLVSCNSGSTSSATSPIDLSPPQAPTNLHGVKDAAISRDWLVWTPSASASVAGYEVYSAPSSSASGTFVATLDASASDYLLPITGTSGTEFYRVRAIGSNNVPSAFTATLPVDRTAWEGTPPSKSPANGGKGDM